MKDTELRTSLKRLVGQLGLEHDKFFDRFELKERLDTSTSDDDFFRYRSLTGDPDLSHLFKIIFEALRAADSKNKKLSKELSDLREYVAVEYPQPIYPPRKLVKKPVKNARKRS